MAATVERFGGIDVAIANAGIAYTGTLASAPVEQVERNPDSLTGRYLAGELSIEVPRRRRRPTALR